MRRLSSWMLFPAIILSACGKTGDRPDTPAAGTGADTTAAAAQPSGSAAIVTVLYNEPKDTAGFERYYRTTHIPLVLANQEDIGFTRADLTRFVSSPDGKEPAYYRQAELYFNSMDDLKKGTASPGFKKVVGDLGNFATGGFTGMIATANPGHETGSSQEPAAIVTVIYKKPKDSAAFEKYYSETHLPLVTANRGEIGFQRAELTRFESNLDGSKPDRYRQAELYFPSMDALKKGTASAGFKKVVDDLSNFASGGLDALVGVETR